MNATDLTPAPGFSQRVHPLTAAETRAALRAIERILVVARHLNREGSTQAEMESILDATEFLPTMLLRPSEFDDLFEITLESLGKQFPMMQGIHDEFRQAAATEQRPEPSRSAA